MYGILYQHFIIDESYETQFVKVILSQWDHHEFVGVSSYSLSVCSFVQKIYYRNLGLIKQTRKDIIGEILWKFR